MEETISLKELLQTLKKRLALIMVITLTAVIVSGVVSFFFLTPIYQSSTQILVNESKNTQNVTSSADTVTNQTVMSTYNEIIKSDAILDLVAEKQEPSMSAAQLKTMISVGSEGTSQVVKISVQDTDPLRATSIANSTAEVFQKEIIDIMNVDNVTILAKAKVTEGQSPIKPQPILNIAIALVVGLMAGVGLAFLLEYFDNTVKNEQDVEKVLGLPILGVISVIEDSKMETMKDKRNAKHSRTRGESFGS